LLFAVSLVAANLLRRIAPVFGSDA
jgi:hypothetical protein